MANFRKIFLDTAPLIYFLGENSSLKKDMDQIFFEVLSDRYQIFTSSLTCEEYLTYNYLNHNEEGVNYFWKFIHNFNVNVRVLDNAVAVEAAKLRAEYKDFKTMDALQLAAAICSGCDVFLTNSTQLKSFDKIFCVTVEEWRTFSKE